jgi:DNA-binding Lrp family transcriptional regulator
LGISGREVSRQLHLSPSAVSYLLQRGQKDGLTKKLSDSLFRKHGKILQL